MLDAKKENKDLNLPVDSSCKAQLVSPEGAVVQHRCADQPSTFSSSELQPVSLPNKAEREVF